MALLHADFRLVACLLVAFLPACEKARETVAAPPVEIIGESTAEVPEEELLPLEISFNEHIQPILSEYCYQCHGPDSGTRLPEEDPLRIDRPEDAFLVREGSGKPVILKGDPEGSPIVRLMRHEDPGTKMPPPESHKTMHPREIALIERWIEQGAEYEDHWAFTPVRKPGVPAAGADWSDNPIDRFVSEKLSEAGLSPNEPEDPNRFHRRLALDTTGLPPSPAETAAFVSAYRENPEMAVKAEASRLLATTASAEHFTRHWLDAARYADTHGIHIDNYRAIWPYRDWVIRAFEANMPWDQFTTEQIAGDMIPDRTLDQHIASGFNRCLSTTGEGGAISEEYEAIYALDRVDTTSAIWLGLTTSCAACHDHKFDPLSTHEFYQLTAFFRNNTMNAMDGNNAEHPPSIFVPILPDRERWISLAEELRSAESQLAARRENARPDYENWLATAVIETPRDIDSTLSLHLPLTEPEGPFKGTVDGEPREWHFDLPRIAAPLGPAPLVSHQPVELGDLASFSRDHQISYGGFVRIEGTPSGAIVARMNPGQAFRGWDLWLENGKPGAHIIDSWDKSANKIVAAKALESGKWHHLMIVFDGHQSGHQSLSIYVDGVNARGHTYPNTVGGNIETEVPLLFGSRHGGDSRLNGQVALQDFRFYRRLLSPSEIQSLAKSSELRHILALPAEDRTPEQNESLFQYFIVNVDAASRGFRERIDALKTEQATLRERGSVSLVMEEKKDGEPSAHILIRGEYANKGEQVSADTPGFLPPMPADAPKNRAGLAQWLNDPENPLPARVTMNRTWYYFFGTGIVETTEDFGIMGSRPSHPKLLDWLAAEFVENGWNYREMLTRIVTSATYRQSGNVSPEKLEADPSNTLLSRGPRIRLDAEQIRDLALAASGSLSPKVGGPPVKPYQPEGIWEAVAMPQSNTRDYRQDSGESLYRRSLYTFWKRSAPPASMEILNAPSREISCVRRDRTNTPLQALVLLNDPQFLEASRTLAAHAMTASPETSGRIDFITQRLLSRVLDAPERSIVEATCDKLLATYNEKPEEAQALISTGESPPPPDLNPAELATWTLIASQIFNLDETLNK